MNGDDVNIRYTKFDTYDKVRKSDLKWISVDVFFSCRMAGKTEDVVSDDLRILPTDDKKTVNLKKRKVRMRRSLHQRCTCCRKRRKRRRRTSTTKTSSPRGSNSSSERRSEESFWSRKE